MCKMRPRDIRQMQINTTATWRQQNTGSRTHKAASCSQAAAARGHHRAAQAASYSPLVLPIIRLHPKTQILQHHWLQREKMSVICLEMDPTREGILLKLLCRCCLVEVGGGVGAVCPVHTPLHVCIWGLGASLPTQMTYRWNPWMNTSSSQTPNLVYGLMMPS